MPTNKSPYTSSPSSWLGSSVSTGITGLMPDNTSEIARERSLSRAERKGIARDIIKAMLSNPNLQPTTPKDLAEQVVAYTDALIHTLNVTEQVNKKMK